MRYGMYTEEGDAVAHAIVGLSRAGQLTWQETLSVMRFVAESRPEGQGELMDTAVREVIYDRCGFTTDFYV